MAALSAAEIDGVTIEEMRTSLIAKVGENIGLRRVVHMDVNEGLTESYLHGRRIGVLINITGGNAELARDLAMHIAASNPICVSESDVPEGLLLKEREIHLAQAMQSGKPADIVEKMVEGKLKKFIAEISLTGQPFVKDPEKTVAQLLGGAGAVVQSFVRFEVGEGIEKKEVNFAEEVRAQAGVAH